MLSNKKILITGASGLLGGRAVKVLSAANDVYALSHRSPEVPVAGVNYITSDFSTHFDCAEFPAKVDVVIHLSQSSRFREFPEQAMNIFNVNVASTARLLEYARTAGCEHFVYASSGGIYESAKSQVNENSPIVSHGSLGYYLASKLCGELLVKSYVSSMDVSILRFFFMYGEGQRRSMLLPRLVDNVRAGNPVQLQGEEGLMINPVHVADAVRALESVISTKGSNTFNVAGNEVVSLKQLAGQIGSIVGAVPAFESAPGEASGLVADISSLKALGWAPQVSLQEGLKELL